MSELIRGKIAAVRSRHSLVEAATGASMAVGSLVGVITLAAALDWWLDFPWILRAVLLGGYLGGAGYLLWRYAITPVIQAPDDEEIALRVEHVEPGFASRLISAVQFARPDALPAGASVAMARAMIQQTEEMAGTVDFFRIVKVKRLLRFGAAAVVVLGLAATLFASGGSVAGDLVARVFLSNTVLPTKSRVECLSGSFAMARGDDAVLKASVQGWRPSLGRAEIEYASGQKQTLMLEQSKEDPSIYVAILSGVQDSFTYRLRVYDGRTQEDYRVTATPRPAVAEISCSVAYPAYTGIGTVVRSTGDLTVLTGSKLQLKVTANKNVRLKPGKGDDANYVQLFTSDKAAREIRVPLTVKADKRTELTAEVTVVPQAVAFTIHLVDDDGIPSKDAAVYRIDVVADRAPTVRISVPDRKEVLVTRQSQLPISYLAEDDFGLGKLTLHYRVDEGDEQTVAMPVDAAARTVRGKYDWPISAVPLPAGKLALEGSVIEFWIEAEDRNDVSGPLKGDTERYQARVVSREDKQKELIERMGEQVNIMRNIAERQDETSKQLGEVIEQPSTTRPAAAPDR